MLDVAVGVESVALAVFETAKNNGRLVNFHELLAMIEQYESASARALS